MISKGCEQCAKGGKMVLFVYGYCDQRDCFYCPLGENRKNVTDVYANERQVEHDEDVLEEAHRMDALGTSITGVVKSVLRPRSSSRSTHRTNSIASWLDTAVFPSSGSDGIRRAFASFGPCELQTGSNADVPHSFWGSAGYVPPNDIEGL